MFTQPDTIIPKPTAGQDFNRCSYVVNNPISLYDPTGHDYCLGGGGGCGGVREGDANGDGFLVLDNPGCGIWCSSEEIFHIPAMKQSAIRDFYDWHGLIDSEPLFENCPWYCQVATVVTALVGGALVAVACPTGTVASFGAGAGASCVMLGGLVAAATTSIYETTRTDERTDAERRDSIACSLAVGGLTQGLPLTDEIASTVAGVAGSGVEIVVCP